MTKTIETTLEGMDEFETVEITTEGQGEQHNWRMQTTEGKYDTSLGCLEWMNDQEFCEDELSETEKEHYAAANDCFNDNAMKLYEDRRAEKIAEADNCFYAESSDEFYCDLSKFSTEDERDEFVNCINNADNDARAIALSTEDAMENHKDQFSYWNNN